MRKQSLLSLLSLVILLSVFSLEVASSADAEVDFEAVRKAAEQGDKQAIAALRNLAT